MIDIPPISADYGKGMTMRIKLQIQKAGTGGQVLGRSSDTSLDRIPTSAVSYLPIHIHRLEAVKDPNQLKTSGLENVNIMNMQQTSNVPYFGQG